MSAWRHIYKSAVLALLAWAGAHAAYADERILSFDETVTVNADGSLYVREVIRVRAEGNKIKRGIYRDFPTIYSGSDGQQYVVDFAFQGASRDGRPEQWRAEDRGNGVRIYVGNPSELVQFGEHTYELVFRTDRQLGYFPSTTSCTGTSPAMAGIFRSTARRRAWSCPRISRRVRSNSRHIPAPRVQKARITPRACRPAGRCSRPRAV